MTRIALRTLRCDSDHAALGALFADRDVLRWNAGPAPADIDRWCAENAAGGPDFRTWVVADAGDGRLLGTVSLFAIDPVRASGEIGYRTVPAERGRGVATAALRSAAEEAFTLLGLGRIELFHAVENEASCRVARRAGFVIEQALPSSHRYGDGQWHDEHRHARLHDAGGSADRPG